MAFLPQAPFVTQQAIADTSTVQQDQLGKIVPAFDAATYGYGEFIYLKGTTSTAVGSAVVYDTTFQSALTGTGSRGPVAIAMAATGLGSYGWYQISGLAVVATTGAVGANVGGISTNASAGVLAAGATATQIVDGMASKTANGTPAANFTVMALARPCANGR